MTKKEVKYIDRGARRALFLLAAAMFVFGLFLLTSVATQIEKATPKGDLACMVYIKNCTTTIDIVEVKTIEMWWYGDARDVVNIMCQDGMEISDYRDHGEELFIKGNGKCALMREKCELREEVKKC